MISMSTTVYSQIYPVSNVIFKKANCIGHITCFFLSKRVFLAEYAAKY